MLTAELDFDLPPALIAQDPARPRDSARLLHWRPREGGVAHRCVRDLPSLLRPGDLLIANDSRVLRARLRGRRLPGGGRVEVFLLRERARNLWECLLKPSSRVRPGCPLLFQGAQAQLAQVQGPPEVSLPAQAIERLETGWLVRFDPPSPYPDVRDLLPMLGEVPLPPYIHSTAREDEYQTVYARSEALDLDASSSDRLDSAAAPTAGLHFTPELLTALRERGAEIEFVTLGVGLGTFKPVQSEDLDDHAMHAEEFFIGQDVARRVARQKREGGRVVAIGTTAARALEAAASHAERDFSALSDGSGHAGESGLIQAGASSTAIFIRPGFRFRCVDALLTNFHLPRSTLLALVAALAEQRSGVPEGGLAMVKEVYAQAVEQKYRFFSFGDAMFIE
jgi:S-adenosylmethionine:tRNA ribosyltransferase-isomerase